MNTDACFQSRHNSALHRREPNSSLTMEKGQSTKLPRARTILSARKCNGYGAKTSLRKKIPIEQYLRQFWGEDFSCPLSICLINVKCNMVEQSAISSKNKVWGIEF